MSNIWDPMPFSSSSKSYWWHAANSAINACQHSGCTSFYRWSLALLELGRFSRYPVAFVGCSVKYHISHLQIFWQINSVPIFYYFRKVATNFSNLSWNPNNCLVVEPTHLKNMSQNRFIFPNSRGENSRKCLKNHHMDVSENSGTPNHPF